MKSEPILVHDVHPTPPDVCLKRLVEFCGLVCRSVERSTFDAELDRAADHDLCILASATTIDKWCHNLPNPTSALNRLCQKAFSVFLYGFSPEGWHNSLAATLSDGAISDLRRFTRADLRYEVSSLRPEITREFSGLSFGCVSSAIDFGFVCSDNFSSNLPLISIDRMPFFVLVPKNGSKLFLLACSAIGDIDEEVNGKFNPTRYFSRLLPAAMFLRSTFKGWCWHSKYRFANFIIDDPPLKRSYGYLNFRDLVSTMDRSDFASTIAFIPWNHRRTDNKVIQLFRERPDRLSLCVHGCDHTAAEFSSMDLALLTSRVELATARMNNLHRQSGLSYSKIMVFPQGRFSTEALTALKANNYLAALNSSASPAPSSAVSSLTVADFLEPAVTRYGGFPLFVRRYPGGLEQFAFDLFFGKPVLVVEHHGYFNDGGVRLADFIARLNSLQRLQWTGLREIMAKSYLECDISNEIAACRLYTNHHVIENHAEHERTFVVTKREIHNVPIHNLLVNGQSTKFTVVGNVLQFTTQIPALSSAVVDVAYRNVLPQIEPEQGLARRSRIWTRRMLSEFRDNILSRSGFLLARADALHRGLTAPFHNRPGRQDHDLSWHGLQSLNEETGRR